ncbi:MAG: hypothetical protein EOO36_01600 [Cytophagaceae bacterium]|nr:MAG: hypothetical protein EOO36_01600 [Cytophagaceae bacterium]
MVHRLLCGIVGWLVLAGSGRAQAQAAAADSAAVAAATLHYTRSVRPESGLFNGPEYVNHTQPDIIGNQFFLSAEPQLGTVIYHDGHFGQVPLSYDLALDQLVMTYPNQAITIALVPEKVKAFSLGTHQFVRVAGDSATAAALAPGYYELLLPGPVRLLARHTKRLQQTTVQQNLRQEFKAIDRLYLSTPRAATEVTTLKSLLASLPAHQAEVQRYARQQRLSFGSDQRQASALSALRYYYTLPQ